MVVTPDGKTAFVGDRVGGMVATIDVKTRTKNPTDIRVGTYRTGWRSRRTAKSPWSPTSKAAPSRRLT
jgi:hypothetical protein